MVDNCLAINYNVDIKIGLVPLFQEDVPMKKIISVVLVALMLFSVVAFSASAAICNCGNHDYDALVDCNCCLDCPTLDTDLLYGCAEKVDGSYVLCCEECKGYDIGVQNCKCDCGCKYCEAINGEDDDNGPALDMDDLFGEQERNDFVSAFQAAMRRVSKVFDGLFDSFNNTLNGFLKVFQGIFSILK